MGRPKGSKNKLEKRTKRKCLLCGKIFYVYPSRIKENKGKYCSKSCYSISQKGNRTSIKTEFKKGILYSVNTEFKKGDKAEKSLAWRGGRQRSQGYISIYKPNHPNSRCNYIFEHRYIVEKCIKRLLTKDETVHHINKIRDDNRIENLYLFPNKSEHTKFHQCKNEKVLKSNLVN